MPDPDLHFTSPLRRGTEIFDALEAPSWAPWLRFSADQLDFQAELFESGQLLLCDRSDEPVAVLSTTRIDWDGQPASLPTWDELAGDIPTFATRYVPDGDALVLLSASVRQDVRGLGVGTLLIDRGKEIAGRLAIENVIGPFRPSDFGTHKLRHPRRSFDGYCALRRDDGAHVDGWLRTLGRHRLELLRVESKAMVVETTAEDFRCFRHSYRPGSWSRVDDTAAFDLRVGEHSPGEHLGHVHAAWECCETGTWYLDDDPGAGAAVYIESNVWGRIPLD
jgi:hypothetical protein